MGGTTLNLWSDGVSGMVQWRLRRRWTTIMSSYGYTDAWSNHTVLWSEVGSGRWDHNRLWFEVPDRKRGPLDLS